jgi:hypothetical protein
MGMDDSGSTDGLLKVVIALLLLREEEKPATLKDKVAFLDDLGVRPVDISKILGRTTGYVSKELAGIRKKKR